LFPAAGGALGLLFGGGAGAVQGLTADGEVFMLQAREAVVRWFTTLAASVASGTFPGATAPDKLGPEDYALFSSLVAIRARAAERGGYRSTLGSDEILRRLVARRPSTQSEAGLLMAPDTHIEPEVLDAYLELLKAE